MKVSRLIELLSRCSPDAGVGIYFPGGDYSDDVQVVEDHVHQQISGEESVFLYSFPVDEEEVQKIWTAEKIKVVAKESDFLKTEAS